MGLALPELAWICVGLAFSKTSVQNDELSQGLGWRMLLAEEEFPSVSSAHGEQVRLLCSTEELM